MDIMIPMGVKDFYIVQKNIANVNKFFDYETIYLVANKNTFPFFKKSFLSKNRVVLVDENSMVPGLSFDSVKQAIDKKNLDDPYYGWYFQQFLKIAFARTQCAKEDYLIWDADTIPLRHIDFKQNGLYLFNLKPEYHVPYFDCIRKILGLEKVVKGSFITEHIVVNTAIMNEMLDKIESAGGTIFFEAIINSLEKSVKCGFSEYETYGTYIFSKYPQKVKERKLATFRHAGKLYSRGVSKKELAYLGTRFDTASFEAGHHPRNFHVVQDIMFRLKSKIFMARYALRLKRLSR